MSAPEQSEAPSMTEGGVTPFRESLRRLGRQFTYFEWAVIGVLGMVLLAGLYAGAMRVAPYEPYTVSEYEVIPDVACEGDVVRVAVDREIDPDYHLDFLRYESRWVETEESTEDTPGLTPRVVSSEAGMIEVPSSGRERIISPVVRGVPPEGEWILETDTVAVGSVGGVRRTQELTNVADKPLVVSSEELPDGRECP